MATRNVKSVGISHHRNEWHIIYKRIKELRNINERLNKKQKRNIFHSHVNNKIQSLVKDYNECPDCIIETIRYNKTERVTHNIPSDIYNTILEISKKSKVPVTSIVDRLIISPLLIEK